MKLHVKGVYEKRKRLADGREAVYCYHRKTGARIRSTPGSSEFLKEVERLNQGGASAVAVPNSVMDLFARYRASARFQQLAPRTRAEYDRALAELEPMIGGAAVKNIKRSHVTQIRDKLSKDRPAWANAVVRVLSAVLSFARDDLEWIDSTPCHKLRLPKGGDGQTPYSEAEIQRFRNTQPRGTRARLAFELLLASAARIIDSTFVETDMLRSGNLPIISQKTASMTVAKATRQVKLAFDAWEVECERKGRPLGRYALGGQNGKPLNRRTLTKEMEDAYRNAGFPPEKRTHGLRYTAATRLLEAGYSVGEIQEVTGHAMASMAWKYCQKKRAAARTATVFNGFDQAHPETVILPRSGAQPSQAFDPAEAASDGEVWHQHLPDE